MTSKDKLEIKEIIDTSVNKAVKTEVKKAVGKAVQIAVDKAVPIAVDKAVKMAVGPAVQIAVDKAVPIAVDRAVKTALEDFKRYTGAIYESFQDQMKMLTESIGLTFITHTTFKTLEERVAALEGISSENILRKR